MSHTFTGRMEPWPALAPYAQEIPLAGKATSLFAYVGGPETGLPVILVHGLGDEADTWRHVFELLAVHHRVIAPDLPGFGRSPLPDGGITMPDMIEVVKALIGTLEAPEVALIGNSLGAMICHAVALELPERVQALVLLDGMLYVAKQRVDLATLLNLLPFIGEWRYTRLRKDPQAAYESLRPYYADLEGLPQKDREFLFRRVNQRVWSDRQRSAYFSVLRSMGRWVMSRQRTFAQQLADLETPTLVIAGEQDQIVSPENAPALAEVQPSAQVAMIPDAGHVPHQERPQAVLDAIAGDARLGIQVERA